VALTRSEGWLHLDITTARDLEWLRNHRRGLRGRVDCHLAPAVAADLLDEVLPLAQRCTVPAELASVRALIGRAQDAGVGVGVAIARHTPVEGAVRFLDGVDAVLLVNDLRHGTLAHGTIDKLLAVRSELAGRPGTSVQVVVDGVCAASAALAVAAGAGMLVVPDPAQLRAVREVVADELRFAASVDRAPRAAIAVA
jgi:pentose-5-phosphate-3-epimerase